MSKGKTLVRVIGGVTVTFGLVASSAGIANAELPQDTRAQITDSPPAEPPPPPPPPPPRIAVPQVRSAPSSVDAEALRARYEAARREVVPLAVAVSAGREVLWSDRLRVSGNGGANYSIDKREAALPCPDGSVAPSNYTFGREQLEVSIRRQISSESFDSFNVSVKWERPDEDCQGQGGQRSVSIMSLIAIPPGETVELEGDGGLRVRLTR